jgi:hypothetical protein
MTIVIGRIGSHEGRATEEQTSPKSVQELNDLLERGEISPVTLDPPLTLPGGAVAAGNVGRGRLVSCGVKQMEESP